MEKEKVFGSEEEVIQATFVAGCLSFMVAGAIGLGLGWIFLGFLQGIGLSLVSAFVIPVLLVPLAYYICNKIYKSQNKANIHVS